jgi:hypothetical protein
MSLKRSKLVSILSLYFFASKLKGLFSLIYIRTNIGVIPHVFEFEWIKNYIRYSEWREALITDWKAFREIGLDAGPAHLIGSFIFRQKHQNRGRSSQFTTRWTPYLSPLKHNTLRLLWIFNYAPLSQLVCDAAAPILSLRTYVLLYMDEFQSGRR